jgi:hypothetical protein
MHLAVPDLYFEPKYEESGTPSSRINLIFQFSANVGVQLDKLFFGSITAQQLT